MFCLKAVLYLVYMCFEIHFLLLSTHMSCIEYPIVTFSKRGLVRTVFIFNCDKLLLTTLKNT